jgi:hypothetical protein
MYMHQNAHGDRSDDNETYNDINLYTPNDPCNNILKLALSPYLCNTCCSIK